MFKFLHRGKWMTSVSVREASLRLEGGAFIEALEVPILHAEVRYTHKLREGVNAGALVPALISEGVMRALRHAPPVVQRAPQMQG